MHSHVALAPPHQRIHRPLNVALKSLSIVPKASRSPPRDMHHHEFGVMRRKLITPNSGRDHRSPRMSYPPGPKALSPICAACLERFARYQHLGMKTIIFSSLRDWLPANLECHQEAARAAIYQQLIPFLNSISWLGLEEILKGILISKKGD